MKSYKLNTLFLVILIMCSINFFELQIVKGSFVRYIQFGYLLIAIIFSLPHLFPKRQAFVLPVQLISISVFLSIFISSFTREQNIIDSIGGSIPVLILVVFFYLKHIQFPIEKIEVIVICYGILSLILYFFQYTHVESGYFIDLERIDTSRGIMRIPFPGNGVFFLTIFMAINKFTTSKKNLWFWGVLSISGIIVTIMQVTRQTIVALTVIYLFHFLKDLKIYKKVIVITSFMIIVYFVSRTDNPIVEGLKNAQDQTIEQGSDYVRVQAAIFFLTDFSNSTFNRIFGNGVPYGQTSLYFKFTKSYFEDYGFWLSDVGLIAVYAMFGIFAVLGYILIWIKSFVIKVPKEYYYLKYYLWFLLLTCLTSDSVYSSNDLIVTVFVIYIYQTIYEREKISSSDLENADLENTSFEVY